MGTAAIFAVASEKPGHHYTTILGCTMDGSRDNLHYLAHLFAETARGLQSVTQVSKNKWHCGVDQVLDAIAKYSNTQWFKDHEKNAQWVSYSAVYDPKDNKLWIYEGIYEYSLGYREVNLRSAKTVGELGLKIAKAYRAAQREALLTPEQKAERDRKAAKKAARAKARALKKLSPEERNALGV